MEGHHSMPTQHRFELIQTSPLYFADEVEHARDRRAVPRVLTASILIVIVTAIGVVVLSGNPVAFFANVTASLADKLGIEPGATDQSMPATQSTADAQILTKPDTQTSTKSDTELPTSRVTVASKPNDPVESEDELFRQFQTWLAKQEVQVAVASAQPVQDAPGGAPSRPGITADSRAPISLVQKRRLVRSSGRNPQSEARPARKPLRVVRSARAQVPPARTQTANDEPRLRDAAPAR